MKPAGAKEALMPMDLSGMSLNNAFEMLEPRPEDYTVLRCASQLVPMALLLLNGWGISLELDFQYSPDEWSLHTTEYRTLPEGVRYTHRSVWSPGA